MMKYLLDERVDKIRDFIIFDSPRKRHALQQDNAVWYMLCSCMDIIEDMEYALESYLTEDPDDSETGRKYLLIFGALQALFVQQDAIKNLHQALNIPYTIDPSIKDIRDIRNDAAGHPTNRGNKEAFIFITRISLEVHEFELTKLDPTKDNVLDSDHVKINVPNLIATQRKIFMNALDNVIETLKEEEMEHRKKFVNKKLVTAFSDTTYPFEKIFDAVLHTRSNHAQLVGSYVDRISECIKAFKHALKERGEPDDNITETYKDLNYTLQHIKAFFDGEKQTHIHRKDAYIFACFARQQIDALESIAREIDEEYSQYSR